MISAFLSDEIKRFVDKHISELALFVCSLLATFPFVYNRGLLLRTYYRIQAAAGPATIRASKYTGMCKEGLVCCIVRTLCGRTWLGKEGEDHAPVWLSLIIIIRDISYAQWSIINIPYVMLQSIYNAHEDI